MALFSSALALLLVPAWSGSALAGSLPATGSQGGFQQQKQFAQGKGATSGDFEEYMKDYAGQPGSQQSQSAGYQQYLGQYWHAGAGNATSPSAEASSTQGGSYQQYRSGYQQYFGDYAHFMGQAGVGNATAPSAGASSTQGGSYQQYMDKYMHQGGTQSGGYGGYVNFMGQAGAGNTTTPSAETSSMQGGSYQQSVDKYMYQGGAQQFQSGKYKQYVDGYASKLTNASDSKEWAAYYMNKYNAGKYQNSVKENSSSYTRRQAAASSSPASASSCHNVSELKAWRFAKLEHIASYVPQAYRASAEDAVERTFHSNQARIEREQAIQAQHLADEKVSKAAREGSSAPADGKVHKVVKQGSAAPADEKATRAAQKGLAEPANGKAGEAAQEGSAAPAHEKATRTDQKGPAELADDKAGEAAQEGSAAPAVEKATRAAQKGPAEPADDKAVEAAQEGWAAPAGHVREPAPAIASGDGVASVETTVATGSPNKRTDQGAADQAAAGPPPRAANASSAGEGSAELLGKTHMDKSVASIAAVAALVALFGAYVGKARCRQRAIQPEGYVNLTAEP